MLKYNIIRDNSTGPGSLAQVVWDLEGEAEGAPFDRHSYPHCSVQIAGEDVIGDIVIEASNDGESWFEVASVSGFGMIMEPGYSRFIRPVSGQDALAKVTLIGWRP